MQELARKAQELLESVKDSMGRLNITDAKRKKDSLEDKTKEADFWQDNQAAAQIMQEISSLQEQVDPWLDLEKSLKEVKELAELGDRSVEDALEKQLRLAANTFESLKKQLAYRGPYDKYSAILSIYAGAGGTDAQDWAQMLQRMYIRWAEKHGVKVSTLDESAGEEAGIKSASLEFNGTNLYGRLKGEHGIHRLVRLSPFNANNLRQTSFAKVEVLPKIEEPQTVPLDDKDLKIDVFRAGGHGGQSVNTTDSAVRITHLPTGITVSIQNERSQIQNKETALTILRSKLAALAAEQHLETIKDLKGPNQSAEWGNQIRSYVLHPYKQVKDLRTRYETSDTDGVLDGDIDQFIDAFAEYSIS